VQQTLWVVSGQRLELKPTRTGVHAPSLTGRASPSCCYEQAPFREWRNLFQCDRGLHGDSSDIDWRPAGEHFRRALLDYSGHEDSISEAEATNLADDAKRTGRAKLAKNLDTEPAAPISIRICESPRHCGRSVGCSGLRDLFGFADDND
jgi:hypothetical protein